MADTDTAAAGDFAEYVSHEEFRAGLAAGRFRVVVNPKLARRQAQRLLLIVVVTPDHRRRPGAALTGRTWRARCWWRPACC